MGWEENMGKHGKGRKKKVSKTTLQDLEYAHF